MAWCSVRYAWGGYDGYKVVVRGVCAEGYGVAYSVCADVAVVAVNPHGVGVGYRSAFQHLSQRGSHRFGSWL